MTVPFQTPDRTISNMPLKMPHVYLGLVGRFLRRKMIQVTKKHLCVSPICLQNNRKRVHLKSAAVRSICNLLSAPWMPLFPAFSHFSLTSSGPVVCFHVLYFQSGVNGLASPHPISSSNSSPTCYPSAASSLPSTISSTLSLSCYAAMFHYSIRSV